MTELDDHDLIAQYAGAGCEPAFATLVARYVNLVYSAAFRFTGNAHHAEEITQAVFIILARKAGGLRGSIVLSGWLYQTARLTAANFVKGEIRRQRREQEVYMQSTLTEPDPAAWKQIAPFLDEAMGQLGAADRDAVVLRFFQNKTAREVAEKLKLTEAAASKRVTRALDKLRKYFVGRGVTLPAAVIAGAVAANSVQAAPAGLVVAVTAATAKGATISATIMTLVKGTLKIMTYAKLKLALGIGAAIIVAGGAATVVLSTTQPATAPLSVEDILARYTRARGGTSSVQGTTTLITQGVWQSQDGMGTLEAEAWLKAPDKWTLVLKDKEGPVWQRGTDGAAGWEVSKWRGPAKIDAATLLTGRMLTGLYRGEQLATLLPNMSLKGIEMIAGREAQVLEVALPLDPPPRLWFDTRTGLLVRIRYAVAGSHFQLDLDDYRNIGGLMLPFTLRQTGSENWTIRCREVKRNAPLDDARFKQPSNQ